MLTITIAVTRWASLKELAKTWVNGQSLPRQCLQGYLRPGGTAHKSLWITQGLGANTHTARGSEKLRAGTGQGMQTSQLQPTRKALSPAAVPEGLGLPGAAGSTPSNPEQLLRARSPQPQSTQPL